MNILGCLGLIFLLILGYIIMLVTIYNDNELDWRD